ncbi:MAG: ATP-binding protein [archaeon]|nr:ATP-binding protein [archaeon]
MIEKKAIKTWADVSSLQSTEEIEIPADPLDRVLGQEEAIQLAKIAAKQRRHLLLVGPPGTGKSMIARAISLQIPKPKSEIRVSNNPENPERPFLEVLTEEEVLRENTNLAGAEGKLLDPEKIQKSIAEKLGYLCKCGGYSLPADITCPHCGQSKLNISGGQNDIFGSMLNNVLVAIPQMGSVATAGKERINTTRTLADGTEETIVFERAGNKIRMLDQKALEKRRQLDKSSNHKVLVKLDRNPFVLATGASETELLGDVRHDPYGGHQSLGTPAYERVIPGSIHEAHKGVLFIDEISHLGPLQRFILTAMQDKEFPIAGRNPQSAGASVKVDHVPCDFILVAACNIQDLENILSPLRSRIIGGGYEVLVDVAMPDIEKNRVKYAQFVAQEITMDGHIPHAVIPAVEAIIAEGRSRAKKDKHINSLTLRLRELGGLIRAAGDIAVMEGSRFITEEHIKRAIKRSRPAEEQISDRYGSYTKGLSKDISESQKQKSEYYMENEHVDDQMFN